MNHLIKMALLFVLFFTIGCNTSSTSILFNGENLDGWEIYGTEKWYVEDGLSLQKAVPMKNRVI